VSGRKTFASFFIGILLVQAAWITAMPAFRGPDEFDHVFRAEGVSHGAFMPGETIATARGTLTPVRRSVIDAASDVCASYKYPGYHDCHAYGPDKGEWGTVGSGAGRYNPAYYVVVGNIARFVDGVAVDYVIRALTAFMCALLLAWAALLWTRPGRSQWRTLAFMTALTPVLLFSTTVAAPNGVSYAAAVLLWTAGLAFLSNPVEQRSRSAATGVAVGAVVMCNTHTTGPLWLLLIALTWVLLKPAEVLAALRDRRNWSLIALVGVGAAVSAAWTLVSGANLPSPSGEITSNPEVGKLAVSELGWLLQTIAAFPLRNEMAPTPVYFLWLIGFIMLIVHAFQGRGRPLLVVLWVAFALIATQTVLTYVGFKTDGYAWQGRYGLPLSVGLALLPAFSVTGRKRPFGPLYLSAALGILIATGLSVWHVAHNERLFFQRPWTDYFTGGPTTVGVVAAIGATVMLWALSDHGEPGNEPAGSVQLPDPLDAQRATEVVR